MLTLLAAAALAAQFSNAPAPFVAMLRAKDQALLDAITSGNTALWDSALAPGALYVDENGTIFSRADYLKTIVTLPPGISGQINITDYQLRVEGNTALVLHKDDEFETYHGIKLFAQYLMSETWMKQGEDWKLALVHVYVVAKDPPAIPLSSADLAQIPGRYMAAPDLTWIINRTGDGLSGGREGKPAHAFDKEGPDLFFVPGSPREHYLLQRDASGNVTGFTDRREGEDIVWKRVP